MTGHLPATSGVYLLTHNTTGDTYVGSAKIIRIRVAGHFSALSKGRHQNERLQSIVDAHGLDFRSEVLEETGDDVRFPTECRWIETLKPTMNLVCAPGGIPAYPAGKPKPGMCRTSFDIEKSQRGRLKLIAALASQVEGKPITMGQLLERWTREGIATLGKKLHAKPTKTRG